MSTLPDHERLAPAIALLRRGAWVSIVYPSLVLQAPRLGVGAAWAIARDLRVGSAKLCTCNACEVSYLVSSASRLAPAAM